MNYGPEGEPSVFAAAAAWIVATLTGSVATAVAIIAVACFGLMLMAGRIQRARVVQLIIGCFILFGARSIAAGIVGALSGNGEIRPTPLRQPPVISPVAPRSVGPVSPYDPYAGAALPPR
jgi:type IV secretory pathway VirB2 component (pilin)